MKIAKKGKDKIALKVMDFSIWNGVKFGFGFIIGSAIASIIFAVLSTILMFTLAYFGYGAYGTV